MNRTYKINPRPTDLGGGWSLKLYEDEQEANGGVFPVQEDTPSAGMDWGIAFRKSGARTCS